MEFFCIMTDLSVFFNPLKMLDQTLDLEIEILEVDLTNIRVY